MKLSLNAGNMITTMHKVVAVNDGKYSGRAFYDTFYFGGGVLQQLDKILSILSLILELSLGSSSNNGLLAVSLVYADNYVNVP